MVKKKKRFEGSFLLKKKKKKKRIKHILQEKKIMESLLVRINILNFSRTILAKTRSPFFGKINSSTDKPVLIYKYS